MFGKKKRISNLSDKNTITCICNEKFCGYCGIKRCKCNNSTDVCSCKEGKTILLSKSLSSRIKKFLVKSVNVRFPLFRSLHFPLTRLPLLNLILRPFFSRIKLIFTRKTLTEQNKAEVSLNKLARLLWDEGKYAEAERINLEVLNVRRLVFGEKK